MQLRCLGSSSTGNCYLLENESECLVLEAGILFKEVKKALDFNISKIVGVLVTHEHGDHSKYISEYRNSGIYVGASTKTLYAMNLSGFPSGGQGPGPFRVGYWYRYGGFSITPFDVVHDAAQPFGFIIRHQEMGTLLFASDTEYIKQNFKSLNLNHIMIECNYSQRIIDGRMKSGNTVKSLRDRVMQSHMELETCKEFINANATAALYTITLLHLSDGNSDGEQFKKEIQEIHPPAEVYVADRGVTVDLDIIPFS